MGLSFAFNVDPLRGSSTPALGQLYIILATLTFLALDGHAALHRTTGRRLVRAAHRYDRARPGRPVVAHRLGRPVVLGRDCRGAARRHRAAHRQPGLRRGEPRGAVAEPVRGRLPGFAGRRSAGRARRHRAHAGKFHAHCSRRDSTSCAPCTGARKSWRSPAQNAQNKLHRSASRRRARKARFRAPSSCRWRPCASRPLRPSTRWGDGAAGQFADLMRDSLSLRPDQVMGEGVIWPALMDAGLRALVIILPILGATFVAALAAPLAIGGWNFSGQALMPQFSQAESRRRPRPHVLGARHGGARQGHRQGPRGRRSSPGCCSRA